MALDLLPGLMIAYLVVAYEKRSWLSKLVTPALILMAIDVGYIIASRSQDAFALLHDMPIWMAVGAFVSWWVLSAFAIVAIYDNGYFDWVPGIEKKAEEVESL
jgi:hypothetical protein